jgi:hypothetical protein
MESVPCVACSTFFIPRNKLQIFCSTQGCQHARKALWQKNKLATDPEYKKGQRLAQEKWLQNKPGYWKEYRRRHPEQAKRNRSLQKIRNMRKNPSLKTIGIAKMDARDRSKISLSGQYWLVPIIAKMDPVKIFIASVAGFST